MIKVVYMGTPEFAASILRELANDDEISVSAVFTRADAPSKRGKALHPSPVKVLAQELGIAVHTPKTLRDEVAVENIREYSPDFIVVAAYGAILPRDVLEIPKVDCVNVHGSLLPRWRGAAPIQRAILAGDVRTGVSIMRMEEGLDTGDYCAVSEVLIGDKTLSELTDELASAGGELLLCALKEINSGKANWTAQDESFVTYAEKIDKDEVLPAPELTALDNLRRINASSASAPARIVLNSGGVERGITLLKAVVGEDGASKGHVGEKRTGGNSLLLKCANNTFLEVFRLKPDGKNEMDAKSFLQGLKADSDTLVWNSARK